MKDPREITVKTYKYDGRLHRSWKAGLVERKEDLLVLLGIFEQSIEHSNLGVIQPGTLSYEYYWLDRCYNVFRFNEPDGRFRNFYCNINLPPKFDGETLEYIDLDIDILVSPEFDVEILDLDEFERHKFLYSYPESLVKEAFEALSEVKTMIQSKTFPFSLK